jgi:predicted PurR-regulated permease PerM
MLRRSPAVSLRVPDRNTSSALDSPRALIVWTIAVATMAVVLVWALYQITGVLLKIYISALLAIGVSPLVRLIEHQRLIPIGTRRLPRWLAILVIYLAFLGAVVGIGMMVIPPLISQAQDLAKHLPQMIDRVQQFLIDRRIIDHKVTWREAFQQAPDATSTLDTIFAALSGLVGGLFGLFSMLILTFYLLIESDDLLTGFLQLFPRERRPRVAMVCRQIAVKVSAWLSGQLLLAGVIGTTASIALWLMGIPYFYVLALIAAVGELIPIVGPVLAAIPAMAVALTVSPLMPLWVALFYIAQQQFESHFLVPKVMSTRVGVSAATVIIAVMTGGSLLGVVGVILAVPTAAILQVVFQEIVSGRSEPLDSLPD